jgi:ATP synthase F1 gamma subunit
MLPAIHIKKTIDFNKGFRSLLEVLKLVAVSEYHNLEKKLKTFERLQDILTLFFDSVDVSKIHHPFLDPGDKPMAVLAVTSDAGLLGGINMQVVLKALEIVRQNNGKLVIMGDRGLIYAQDAGFPFVHFPGIVDAKRAVQAFEMRDFLTQKILQGEYGALKVVFPKAHSFVVHRVEVVTLVPFISAETEGTAKKTIQSEDMIFESSSKDIVEYLVYLIIGQRLFEIFGMARVCEQAARFVHLEESCSKISDMNKKLLLQYFRRRHEIIDANMRELFSARSLYAK